MGWCTFYYTQPGTDRRVTCGINPSPHQSSVDPSSTVPWVFHISHVGCYIAPNATMSPRGSNDFDMIGVRGKIFNFPYPPGIRNPTHIPNLRSLAMRALIAKHRGRGSVMSSYIRGHPEILHRYVGRFLEKAPTGQQCHVP